MRTWNVCSRRFLLLEAPTLSLRSVVSSILFCFFFITNDGYRYFIQRSFKTGETRRLSTSKSTPSGSSLFRGKADKSGESTPFESSSTKTSRGRRNSSLRGGRGATHSAGLFSDVDQYDRDEDDNDKLVMDVDADIGQVSAFISFLYFLSIF